MDQIRCGCGRPLHYTSLVAQMQVERLVEMHGEYVTVISPSGREWQVSRHYIALHGLRGPEVDELGRSYGWVESS